MDLTGDDDIIDEPKKNQIDTISSKGRHKIVDRFKTQRVDAVPINAFYRNTSRVADQPKKKRVKVAENHKWSDSDDELQASEVESSSAKNVVKGASILRTSRVLLFTQYPQSLPEVLFIISFVRIYITLLVFSRFLSYAPSFLIYIYFFPFFIYILTVAIASKLLQKFQLPKEAETATLANAAKVVVTIPSVERGQFAKKLERLRGPPVSVVNDIDETSPPPSFDFVNESIIGKDVEQADEEFMSGCECREENGRNCGCEYRSCHCLQQSDRDENGHVHFPYAASQRNRGCLRQVYLDSRFHIYECNQKCNCKANCKNKLVQHGRQVPLEIFKTTNRGWGKFCTFD